ncbi:hypothetical protein ASD00_32855 [Ensifer sp. Root31]|nr:hypothetical protein ASD00_32855 [Ensifer sp. Root31]
MRALAETRTPQEELIVHKRTAAGFSGGVLDDFTKGFGLQVRLLKFGAAQLHAAFLFDRNSSDGKKIPGQALPQSERILSSN